MRRLFGYGVATALVLAVPAIAQAQSGPAANPAPVPDPSGGAAQPPSVPAPTTPAPAPVETPKPAPAPAPKVVKPVAAPKVKAAVDGLKPGQYVWEQRAGSATSLRIVVVLDIQRLYVFDGGTLVAFTTISTGKKGHATPTGNFRILQKNVTHFSNIYDNAPMPYMQRLTWDGIALHAGKIPGYPASHGCVRLPLGFAKLLFAATKMDQLVTILPDLSTPAPKEEPKTEPVVTPEPKVDGTATPVPVPAPAPTPVEPAPVPVATPG